MQDRAFQLLKSMIDDGRLSPGEKLLEARVSKAFGISRSPARYALRKLCEQQLILEVQGRGYEVAGKRDAHSATQHATLDAIKIPAVARWEGMYNQLEQTLCSSIIFNSVRIIEERVAEHFHVSRTVVRDVLARMHSVGLVNKDTPGRWIAPQVTPEKTHHLYEIRWLLEPQALIQAAPKVPQSYLLRARQTVEQSLDGFPRDGFDTDIVENDLHVTLLSYCPNVEILQVLARTRILFVPTRYLFDPVLHIPISMIEDALKEHLRIYDLLLSNQPQKAAGALRLHLQQADERWLKRFNRAVRPADLHIPDYLLTL
ncbi:GntR family transcriptional regulator [Izhakiella australiensis]|uniref:GntR family transcriptional regulator n=1 Tax=Izhakiella australiensis TaxID=1926881 RepID=UPI0018E08463|nr:GntR family transcriptional regulator [Izhakiella australiensis]